MAVWCKARAFSTAMYGLGQAMKMSGPSPKSWKTGGPKAMDSSRFSQAQLLLYSELSLRGSLNECDPWSSMKALQRLQQRIINRSYSRLCVYEVLMHLWDNVSGGDPNQFYEEGTHSLKSCSASLMFKDDLVASLPF
ncbi:hypothetical protein F2Q69_00004125 [Brassica cretica]|uniref:Uncharacterized protein n=1 Tax=Brassica cretica TaxID=69181 RepID=A0A8S9P0N0_BRACR|nr:hypothetical protein F2Q69_00004125 [Brassica cretica]